MWNRKQILSWYISNSTYIIWLELENETKAYNILDYVEIGE